MHVRCSLNVVRMSLSSSVTNMATVRCVEIMSAIFNTYGTGAEVKGKFGMNANGGLGLWLHSFSRPAT